MRSPSAAEHLLASDAGLARIDELDVSRSGDGFVLHASTLVDATSSPYLIGHFPGVPIFPGVFVIDALRAAMVAAFGQTDLGTPEIAALRSTRFFAPFIPGNTLIIDATVGAVSPQTHCFEVDARCLDSEGTLAARLKVAFRGGRRTRA